MYDQQDKAQKNIDRSSINFSTNLENTKYSGFHFMDNRPQFAVQKRIQKQTNEPIQLKVASDGNTIHALAGPGSRYDFRANLQAAMPVAALTARCHIISYKSITDTVADALHSYNTGHFNLAQTQNHLNILLSAVYPNGAAAATHPGHVALGAIAVANHASAIALIGGIPARPAAGFSVAQKTNLANRGNNIIRDLNDSPDNLRVGNSLSNSSIQDLLDPRGPDIARQVHAVTGSVRYLITGVSALQIWNLYRVSDIRLGVSNALIAHSEVAGVNVNNMGAIQPGGITVRIAPVGLTPIDFQCT